MSTQDANDYINELTEERKVLLEDIAKKWYAIRDKTQKMLVNSTTCSIRRSSVVRGTPVQVAASFR
jgi:hypothetical protein